MLTAFILFISVSHAAPPPAIVQNPIAMTLTQALAIPRSDSFSTGFVTALPKRRPVFLLEEHQQARFKFRLQSKRSAPLVFVLPGTGGSSGSPTALYLAEKVFQSGNHVVTVDNPFSWNFTVAASRNARPGYPPDDAIDLYSLMASVRSKLVRESGISPASYSVVGYSLGALQSVFVKRIDDRTGQFGFKKVLLINPAVDLLYALDVIDKFHVQSQRLSKARRDWAMGRVLNVGEKYLTSKTPVDFSDPAFLGRAFSELNFKNSDMIHLIAKTFRDSLRDVIFASQQVRDLGILRSPVSRYRRNARYDEAGALSFRDYVNRFLIPGRDFSLEKLNQLSSLYQFADDFKSQPGIVVVTSADDFILKPSDRDWLRDNLGSRFVLFPYGGHCGGILFPEMTKLIDKMF